MKKFKIPLLWRLRETKLQKLARLESDYSRLRRKAHQAYGMIGDTSQPFDNSWERMALCVDAIYERNKAFRRLAKFRRKHGI